MTRQRAKRVAAALKHEISHIIHGELRDPRIGFITVTKVDLTADLRSAKIYFSILGSEKDKRDTLIGLKRATGYMRKLIGERLKLRYTPEVVFYLDETSEYVQHIQEIIDKIHKEDNKKFKDKT